MTSKLKYALILGLVSTTSLTSFASTNPTSMPVTHSNVNNAMDVNKGIKEIKTSNIKALKSHIHHKAKHIPHFKPFLIKRLTITLNGAETNLESAYNDYVDQRMTQEALTKLNEEITNYYIKHDYLMPRIEVSKHAMKSGVLLINVVPANIDNVVIVGEGENNKLIREYAEKILNEKPAKVANTQRYLALMNKLPGYEAHYQLKQEKDTVDLVVYTTKKKWSAYMGVDNYGLSDLGKYQASALAQAYSPFGGNESLLVHGSTTDHPNRLNDIGVGYSQPLNAYGTSAHLFAARSEDNATKKDVISAKNNSGYSFRLALTHHLILKANEDLEAEAGAAYKNSSTYKVENDVSTQHKSSKYWAGDLGLKYLVKDQINGRNLFHMSYVQGLSGTFKNYLADESLANKHYSVGRFNFYREQPLKHDFSIFSHLAASYSGDNLPDSEKAILGGRDFGRGYDFGTLDGTKLIALSLEVRYTKKIEENKFIEHVQPYIFHDMGHVGKQASNTNISTLKSAGLGVRFRLDYGIDLGAEAAQPFKKNYTVDGTDIKAKTKYSFFVNKVFEF